MKNLFNKKTMKSMVWMIISFATLMWIVPAEAGTSAILSGVETETNNAAFGTGGKAILQMGSMGGGLMALMTGKFMVAGLGLGIGGLTYLSSKMSGSTAYSALIN